MKHEGTKTNKKGETNMRKETMKTTMDPMAAAEMIKKDYPWATVAWQTEDGYEVREVEEDDFDGLDYMGVITMENGLDVYFD